MQAQNMKTLTCKPVRDSNIELFRIVTMLFIIAHHYVVNSGIMNQINVDPTCPRSLFLLLCGAWGKTGINCFVMISGYFLCKSQISLKKAVKLMLEVAFYGFFIYMLFIWTGYENFSIKYLVQACFPYFYIKNNFVSGYMLFYLCVPFLNTLTSHLTEKTHFLLILLCSYIYVFVGTLTPIFHRITVNTNYFSWFCVVYLFASFIRLYPRPFFEGAKRWGFFTAGSMLLSALSVVVCAHIDSLSPYAFVTDCNTLLATLTGICAFLFFRNLKIRPSRLINTAAASAYGVLLIHAHSDAMRQWLWKDTLNCSGMYASPLLPLHLLGSVIGIYVVCASIDYLRIRFLEKPFFRLWDRCIRIPGNGSR